MKPKRRLPKLSADFPDVDQLSLEDCRELVDSWPRKMKPMKWAALLFPDRRIGYVIAARLLYAIAKRKLHGHGYGDLRKRLPPWAQHLRNYNPLQCVRRGLQYRKYPPRKKS